MGQKGVPPGLKFLTSDKLESEYHNDIFVGSFLDGRLYLFSLNDDRHHLSLPSELSSKILQNWDSTGSNDIVFGAGFGRITSLNRICPPRQKGDYPTLLSYTEREYSFPGQPKALSLLSFSHADRVG